MPLSLKLPEGCMLSNLRWNFDDDDDDDDESDADTDTRGVSWKNPFALDGKESMLMLILCILVPLLSRAVAKYEVGHIIKNMKQGMKGLLQALLFIPQCHREQRVLMSYDDVPTTDERSQTRGRSFKKYISVFMMSHQEKYPIHVSSIGGESIDEMRDD